MPILKKTQRRVMMLVIQIFFVPSDLVLCPTYSAKNVNVFLFFFVWTTINIESAGENSSSLHILQKTKMAGLLSHVVDTMAGLDIHSQSQEKNSKLRMGMSAASSVHGGKVTPTIRAPANNNLATTLPFRASAFSAPSSFSANRAKVRSAPATKCPPRFIDVQKAKGSSFPGVFAVRRSPPFRPYANHNLATTLPFRKSSAFAAPSQFTASRARVRSARAKKSPPMPINVLRANGPSWIAPFSIGPSPILAPNPEKIVSKTNGRKRQRKFIIDFLKASGRRRSRAVLGKMEEENEKEDQEEITTTRVLDPRVKFIIGPSSSPSPKDEMVEEGKSQDHKSPSEEEVLKYLGWFWRRV